ncbi:uncharacterized protein LOC111066895 [Drosophila obscura]|uniref:uncharacterized protein LOC111066895 n=1 Tax=Drosophila obscura TaxID=7282 RepID=UPI000B9FCEEE|nr:uncharacterized protein LOC111066895 [Drosophila obscura]
MRFAEPLGDSQISMVYFVGAPIFISMLLVHFYYCWLSVRECRRSSVRNAYLNTPLLSDAHEPVL